MPTKKKTAPPPTRKLTGPMTRVFMGALKARMKDQGVTHKAMAATAKVTTMTIWRLLNEKGSPSLDLAARMAKAVGAELPELLR